jgi:hypothetical protein
VGRSVDRLARRLADQRSERDEATDATPDRSERVEV